MTVSTGPLHPWQRRRFSSKTPAPRSRAPGPVEIGMLNRFTGSAERKAGLVAGVPLGRAGSLDEIAQTIVFIESRKAPFLTGQIAPVDGGKSAQWPTSQPRQPT
jgi:NAD(P)-dependent dehydrogenase (short-subunit alcohol dehydrogenase family)